jgi:hypothetical protein
MLVCQMVYKRDGGKRVLLADLRWKKKKKKEPISFPAPSPDVVGRP